jgi:hypothetical protein
MDTCRNFTSEGSSACNPIVFEPIVTSILLALNNRQDEVDYKSIKLNGTKSMIAKQ